MGGFGSLSAGEILILLAIAFLVLGPGRLPEAGNRTSLQAARPPPRRAQTLVKSDWTPAFQANAGLRHLVPRAAGAGSRRSLDRARVPGVLNHLVI